MAVLRQIATWADQRPLWQQHALRKLIDKTKLDASDLRELAELCKAEHGLGESSTLSNPEPLEVIQSGEGQPSEDSVVLQGIRGLRNVNALRDDQTLTISPAGLTVVYGDNGSGKTGYVRVIKQLCRARGARDAVHPNVYKEVSEPASATLDYTVGTEAKNVLWTGGGTSGLTELTDISVFDSRTAAVYVTGDNDVAYLPQGMDLFPRLVRVVESVGSVLESELSRLNAQADRFETVPTGTKVGEALSGLRLLDARRRIERLMTLSDEDLRDLDRLRAEDKRNKAEDALERARELRSRADRLGAVAERLIDVKGALSNANLADLRSAQGTLLRARQVADLASAQAFADAPIQGVGTETWRALWESARRFSVTGAQPTQPFPPSGTVSATCVLCQQQIAAPAQQRMTRFEEFVRNDTSRAVAEAEQEVRRTRDVLERSAPAAIADSTILKEIDDLDPKLVAKLHAAIHLLSLRRELALTATSDDEWAPVPTFLDDVSEPLSQSRIKARGQAEIFEAASDPAAARAVEDALRELEARVALGKLGDRVARQIEREELAAKLRICMASANTTPITKRNTELLSEAVTQPLGAEFLRQVDSLSLQYLPLSVHGSYGEKGRTFHRLELESKQRSPVPTDEVLSEGEHRATALAAFFAEVAFQRSRSTLVFDDPVSSLDHGRRQYVARRIVELAAVRPVLVFTHDLVFLWMLQGAAEENDVPLQPRYFRRDADGAGFVTEEFPWDGQRVKARAGVLRNSLGRLRNLAASDVRVYELELRDFYGRLRECWERGVEEVLFNGALRRFAPEIKTLSLKKLYRVTEQQMQQFENGMTKASRWIRGHDQPAALGAPLPGPAELEADLRAFEDWVDALKKQYNT